MPVEVVSASQGYKDSIGGAEQEKMQIWKNEFVLCTRMEAVAESTLHQTEEAARHNTEQVTQYNFAPLV